MADLDRNNCMVVVLAAAYMTLQMTKNGIPTCIVHRVDEIWGFDTICYSGFFFSAYLPLHKFWGVNFGR